MEMLLSANRPCWSDKELKLLVHVERTSRVGRGDIDQKSDYDVFLNRVYCSLGSGNERVFAILEVISSASVQIDPLIPVHQTFNHVDIKWVSLPAKCSSFRTVKWCLCTYPGPRWRKQRPAWL